MQLTSIAGPATQTDLPSRNTGSTAGPGRPARSAAGTQELSPREKRKLAELKATDAAVRDHERAHLAAAAQYARGGASYQYEIGPDGKRYAVRGEVQIEASAITNNPGANIRKMQAIKRAALAPRNPSPHDQRVATQAARAEMEARAEQARARVAQAKAQGRTNGNGPPGTPAQAPLINQFV